MIEWGAAGVAVLAAAVGYGELRGKVKSQEQQLNRLEEKVDHITLLLVEEFRGEGSSEGRGDAPGSGDSGSGRK